MHREALAVDALRRTGRLRLQVRGQSMLPALWPGDVAEIVACSLEQVRRGEIVLAFRDGRLFLHRFLARCEPAGFLTRGDSMPGPDPQFPCDTFLGKLAGVDCAGETICAPAPLGPWSRLLGALLCHCSPARRLALKLHGRKIVNDPECATMPDSA
jgi:hypothetical protein